MPRYRPRSAIPWWWRAARWVSPVVRCETLEVRDTDGTPPYVVRWEDGHDGVTYPGSDASVTHSA